MCNTMFYSFLTSLSLFSLFKIQNYYTYYIAIFLRTEVLFVGPLIPLFWISGDFCPGFQSQGGSLACFLTCVILRFTSGVTPADCIEGNMAAEPFQSTYLQMCPQALVSALGFKARVDPLRAFSLA